MSKKVELGDEVECKITGFKGVINGQSQWLTGCDKVSVQSPLQQDGKYGESLWLDAAAVKIIKKGKVKPEHVQESGPKVGGPAIRISRPNSTR